MRRACGPDRFCGFMLWLGFLVTRAVTMDYGVYVMINILFLYNSSLESIKYLVYPSVWRWTVATSISYFVLGRAHLRFPCKRLPVACTQRSHRNLPGIRNPFSEKGEDRKLALFMSCFFEPPARPSRTAECLNQDHRTGLQFPRQPEIRCMRHGREG